MDALETALGPLLRLVNRNIDETTAARELCDELHGTTVAVRVANTGFVAGIRVDENGLSLSGDAIDDPDVAISGSLLTLLRMGDDGAAAIREGRLDLTGDAEAAAGFQRLVELARPDLEEELSGMIGDSAAHGLGEMARGLRRWGRGVRATMADNVREYLQEESRDAPTRHEVDRLGGAIDTLRDDVDRLAARIDRLSNDGPPANG